MNLLFKVQIIRYKGVKPIILKSSFFKDTLIYLLAFAFERLVSFFLIPIMTSKISQAEFGIWNQILATATLAQGVILLGIPTAIIRFYSGKTFADFTSEIKTLFFISLSFLSVLALTFIFFPKPLSLFIFGSSSLSLYTYPFILFLLSEVISELITSILRTQGRIKILSFFYILKNAGRVLVFLVCLNFLSLSFYQSLYILTFFLISVVFFQYWLYLRNWIHKTRIDLSKTKQILEFSLPLVPYSLLIWSTASINRYFLLHFANISEVAIYSVAYSLAAILGVIISVLGFTLYPKLSERWNKGEVKRALEIFKICLYIFIGSGLIFTITITVLYKNIVAIIAPHSYLCSPPTILALATGVFFFGIYQIFGYFILILKKTKENLLIALGGMITNLIACAILVPIYKILGAAIAFMAANTALALLAYLICKKDLKVK